MQPEYVKYRCEKVGVITIRKIPKDASLEDVYEHFFEYDEITSGRSLHAKEYTGENFTYMSGGVSTSDFNDNLNVACSKGIHVFLNLEPTYYYLTCGTIINGIYKTWHSNGNQESEIDNKSEKTWYISGGKKWKCLHKNGIRDGSCIEYYPSGETNIIRYYENGKLEGSCIEYYRSEKIKIFVITKMEN